MSTTEVERIENIHKPPTKKSTQIKLLSVEDIKFFLHPLAKFGVDYSSQDLGIYYTHVETQCSQWFDPFPVCECSCSKPTFSKIIRINKVFIGLKQQVDGNGVYIGQVGLFNCAGYETKGQNVMFSIPEAYRLLLCLHFILEKTKHGVKAGDWSFFESFHTGPIEDYFTSESKKCLEYKYVNFAELGFKPDYILTPQEQSEIPDAYVATHRIYEQSKKRPDPKKLLLHLYEFDIFKTGEDGPISDICTFTIKKTMGYSDTHMVTFSIHEAQHLLFYLNQFFEESLKIHM